ncbi:RlmE family RNA methyltransferase [Desulforhabdus amnigena]|jgi:23S rRNA (uridine2552-2'-O)-methyltransferase|uniref:Ribosomal RNA large subunit methyltransferase E n=1 Tax=Desulforhabdus amnigena TaxID=40218 RepID=A0A9W6D695_9BACT|nr:RlmE family RNA methyltransferase [Desulforhabdus amnigena]NLJ29399.1 RlmE family RNA methyltransferase [Deltaproteobacteria bacterium]GLI34331.1 ribosomal RNA large subunit methyltransferase E [Desulforhabdus amnigena]
MSYKFQDHYFHRAKKEKYLARAVYKLDEIQKKHQIIKPGNRVLDLGAAPGSWMQLTSKIVGPKGLLVGVDLKEISHSFPDHVVVFQRDIYDPEFLEALQRDYAPFDVVLSDMAPSTSGIKAADSARSELLFERALHLAMSLLKEEGHFLAKIFQGSDFHAILQEVKKYFGRVKVVKPDASKKESKEIYILAMRFKKP